MPRTTNFRLSLAVACLIALVGALPPHSYPQETTRPEAELRLFVSPDEGSEVVASIERKMKFVPVADLVGTDGTKWYLVRLDNGATGWLKEPTGEAAKNLESYFKPVPPTISLSTGKDVSSRAGAPS